MGAMRNLYKFWLRNLKERDNFEDLGIDGRIILIKEKNVRMWTGFI
jgi:hypothetical protein